MFIYEKESDTYWFGPNFEKSMLAEYHLIGVVNVP